MDFKLPELHYPFQFIRPPLSQFSPLFHKDLGRILWLAVCGNCVKKGLDDDINVFDSNFLGLNSSFTMVSAE